MEYVYLITALLMLLSIHEMKLWAKSANLEWFLYPSLGRGYRKYRNDLANGEFCFDNWLTIGPITFRWFSSK